MSFASPVDTSTFGSYSIKQIPGDTRPVYRFTGRLTADGSSGWPAEPGRYHIYAGWFCPWAQRVMIERALNGLEDVISASYVDGVRDGRGWAFREKHGPDPVNGFSLLREAYEATEPGFDGHISVPTLWDRKTKQVVSNDFTSLGIDLATQFGQFGRVAGSAETYPVALREEIEQLDSWIGPDVNRGGDLAGGFARLEALLADRQFLVGGQLTEADVRLFVTLARHDASSAATASGLYVRDHPHLWSYAHSLYDIPAFRTTTESDSAFALQLN